MTSIERKRRQQPWWALGPGTSVSGQVSGAAAAVEIRLLHDGTPSAEGHRYVGAVTLDRKAHDWRAFKSSLDTTVTWTGGRVGDRDRIDIPLTPGVHQLGVSLLARHGSRILVRIRQSDARED